MSSRRVLKTAEAIREVVAGAILTHLRDPRIQDATVTFVEVTRDMRQAKVHVSVMGDENKQKLTIHGLQNAAGFLQQKIAQRIDTRYTPKLRFVLDHGVKNAAAVIRSLNDVLPKDDETSDADSVDAEETAAGRGVVGIRARTWIREQEERLRAHASIVSGNVGHKLVWCGPPQAVNEIVHRRNVGFTNPFGLRGPKCL